MKALWLNDGLVIQPEEEGERAALSMLLTVLERHGMRREDIPSTGYATEADPASVAPSPCEWPKS